MHLVIVKDGQSTTSRHMHLVIVANRRVRVCAAAEICRESIPGLQIDHVNMSDLPLLNTDLEAADGAFPPAVEAFRDRVRGADCFLFASPDYNYSISGTYVPAASPITLL